MQLLVFYCCGFSLIPSEGRGELPNGLIIPFTGEGTHPFHLSPW